ncbi:hypothetical protein WR25_04041 [Diploscapter pachys]|uniref:Thioredoxin domain-containing protein n=1 Tax=Diploscapter pachys TaxID=2018661 RepID=A0A2A2KM37_9BILA|nr:hypothetical protein WR25_04041 [Diploscapter pachys]
MDCPPPSWWLSILPLIGADPADVMQQYGVRAMPTFVFLKNRTEVERIEGPGPDGLVATITKHYSAPSNPSAALEQQFAAVSRSTWDARMSQRSGGDTSSSSRTASIVFGRGPADSIGVIEAGGQVHGYRQESEQVVQSTTVYSSSQSKLETSRTKVPIKDRILNFNQPVHLAIFTITSLILVRQYTRISISNILENTPPDCLKDIVEDRYRNWGTFKELNDKFANYIERVRFLQAQTAVIQHYGKVIGDWETQFVPTISRNWEEFLENQKVVVNNERGRIPSLEEAENQLKKNLHDIIAQYRVELDKYNRLLGGNDAELRELAKLRADSETVKMQIGERQKHVDFLKRQVNNTAVQLNDYKHRIADERSKGEAVRNQAQHLVHKLDRDTEHYVHILRDELPHIIDELTNKYRHEFRDKLRNEIARIREDFEKVLKANEINWMVVTAERKEMLVTEIDKLKQYTNKRLAEIKDIEKIVTDLPKAIEREANRNLDLAYQIDNKLTRSTLQNEIFGEHWRIRQVYFGDVGIEKETLIRELQKICDEYQTTSIELEKYRRLLEDNHIHVGIISQPSSRGSSTPRQGTPPVPHVIGRGVQIGASRSESQSQAIGHEVGHGKSEIGLGVTPAGRIYRDSGRGSVSSVSSSHYGYQKATTEQIGSGAYIAEAHRDQSRSDRYSHVIGGEVHKQTHDIGGGAASHSGNTYAYDIGRGSETHVISHRVGLSEGSRHSIGHRTEPASSSDHAIGHGVQRSTDSHGYDIGHGAQASGSSRHSISHGVDIHGPGSGYQPYVPAEEHRERHDTKASNASSAGETTATVRFRIRRHGRVTFTRPVGNHYVVVENRNDFEVDISRWRIEEIVNGNHRGQFVFPEGTTLLPKKEAKASS